VIRQQRIAYYSSTNRWYLGKEIGESLQLKKYGLVSVSGNGKELVSLEFHNDYAMGNQHTSELIVHSQKHDNGARTFVSDILAGWVMEHVPQDKGPVNIWFVVKMQKKSATLTFDLDRPVIATPRRNNKNKRCKLLSSAKHGVLPHCEVPTKEPAPESRAERVIRKLITKLGNKDILTYSETVELLDGLADD